MLEAVKRFVRTRIFEPNPVIYDFFYSMRPISVDVIQWIDRYSRAHAEPVTFIQIGANDGLRGDPIRRFIVRDKWEGILVEPLPNVFSELKSNYRYLKRNLTFVNAAISNDDNENLVFWTYSDGFLQSLDAQSRMELMRLSSFDRKHVEKYVKNYDRLDEKIVGIPVKLLSVEDLVESYSNGKMADIIIIDAEGLDDSIIMGIDLEKYRPEAIVFETYWIDGERKDVLHGFLNSHGYNIIEMDGNSVAVEKNFTLL